MRIVFITNSIGFGGAEKMMAFVANGMAHRGHRVSVINFNSIGDYVNDNQQSFEDDIEINNFRTNSSGRLIRIQKIRFSIDVVKRFHADVMVCFTAFPNYAGKIISLVTGVPSIMSERGNPYATINKKNIPSLIELTLINHSAGAIFQIPGAAKFYSKGLQKRGTIIPNPIFVNEMLNPVKLSEREKSIVSVGRLDNEQKRYDVMIKAFSLFVERYPDWVLKLYGTGADEALIKQWCVEEGVADKVLFMGISKHPMLDTNKAGMFIITSDFEGISNSLLEAMAIGLPCVSTDSAPGGARMLIDNMNNGLLAPIGNPEKIAEAMGLFACNPLFAQKCGEKAKEVISRFDPILTLDKWENYIKKFEDKI